MSNEEEKHDDLAWDALVDDVAKVRCCCDEGEPHCHCKKCKDGQGIIVEKREALSGCQQVKSPTKGRYLFNLRSSRSDLELAAEIGKTLLERNRELEIHLKRVQDFAEEQQSRAEYHRNQVELLRDENEIKTRLCEQLESQVQESLETSVHNENECKLLRVRNRHLFETVESLERRLETAQNEMKKPKTPTSETCHYYQEFSQNNKSSTAAPENELTADVESAITCECRGTQEQLVATRETVCKLEASVVDMEAQLEMQEKQYQELENDFKAVLEENESLQQQKCELEIEISEWKNITNKVQHQLQIAERFCSTMDIGKCGTKEMNAQMNILKKPHSIAKSKSCEVLSTCLDVGAWKPTTAISDLNGSVLDELDSYYSDLMKRYEQLLLKIKDENRLSSGEVESTDIHEAVQSLSYTSSVEQTQELVCEKCKHSNVKEYPSVDYQEKFAQIFAKLKEIRQQTS